MSRREALATIGAAGLLGECATAPLASGRPATEAETPALLDWIADNVRALLPEQATSLGIDKRARASLRSMLTNRSTAGQARIAAALGADSAPVEAIEAIALTFPTRTSVEVATAR